MAGVDLQNGYLRIANELYDEILAFPFSKRELLIVLAVVRKTYGFNKKADEISNYQITKMTGISLQHVGLAIDKLVQMHVLTVNETGTVRRSQPVREIGLNKSYPQWSTVNEMGTVKNKSFSKRIIDRDGKRNGNLTVNETGTTKDNTKNNKKQSLVSIPSELNLNAWKEYLQHRIEKRCGALKPASQKKLMGWLVEQGGAATQQLIVDQSIRNGWQGLFELKQKIRGVQSSSNSGDWSGLGKQLGVKAKRGESMGDFVQRVQVAMGERNGRA